MQAYNHGRYYPSYAWILLGRHEIDWWREHYMETNCSESNIIKVLNRSLVLTPYPNSDNDTQEDKVNFCMHIYV